MPHKDSIDGVPPDPTPESDWIPLKEPKVWPRGDFLQPESTGERTRISYFERKDDEHLYAEAWFGAGTEGGPGNVHGGALAAVLDELMGFCAWYRGHPVMTGQLTVTYRKPMPINTEARCESWIDRIEDRKVFIKGALSDTETHEPYCEGEAIFIKLKEEHLVEMAERYQAYLERKQASS